MKKLINDPRDVVRESLAGLAAAHPEILRVCFDPVYVIRADAPIAGKVGIVSGGGSGHEPMHGGFVGKGMLDAACPGEVFTSPTPDQIEAATCAVDGGAGVLHIIKNYTGDIMNFEMAAELCQARGVAVQAVIVNDDVAVEDSLYTAGRRGVGTTVLAEKICGAAAGRGYDLGRVAELGRKVNRNGRSMGLALSPCTVPAAGKPGFVLAADEIEMGVGIHGEPGRERMSLKTARDLTAQMAEAVLADLPFQGGDRVVTMVNGMGATPLMELYLVHHELEQILQARRITIAHRLVGNYITSLEMAGCSITLLKADDEFLSLWGDPVLTPGLRWGI
ncbi:MAG TPA: dihydroxyacetone kinase subunit DhaK [Bryobacteraceae bacterium]|nr:dihydroxyacetone kinase subunit DhaK [Bryobacteraceae bacterium]